MIKQNVENSKLAKSKLAESTEQASNVKGEVDAIFVKSGFCHFTGRINDGKGEYWKRNLHIADAKAALTITANKGKEYSTVQTKGQGTYNVVNGQLVAK